MWPACKRTLLSREAVDLVPHQRIHLQALKEPGVDGAEVVHQGLVIRTLAEGILIEDSVAQPVFYLPVDAGS